jgi:hypothetical protein
MKEKAMVYIFFGLIVLFACTSTVYLFANDFAHESLEVLFPAVGAILVSGYFGYKFIYIDAPKPVKFGVPIAILHDFGQGKIRGMAPRSIQHLPRLYEFRGAGLLDDLPVCNDFKQQGFSDVLRDVSQEPNCPATVLIEHFVEYALLRWLCNPDVSVGCDPGYTSRLINSEGGGGSARDDLVETPISGGANDPNPLLQASPFKIPLPPGSKIIRSADRRLAFQVVTRHTKVDFRHLGGGGGLLERPIGKEAERIFSAIGLPDRVSETRMLRVNIDITATQFPFKRHSEWAKMESEWIARLKDQIEKDFSWERLRALYAEE